MDMDLILEKDTSYQLDQLSGSDNIDTGSADNLLSHQVIQKFEIKENYIYGGQSSSSIASGMSFDQSEGVN